MASNPSGLSLNITISADGGAGSFFRDGFLGSLLAGSLDSSIDSTDYTAHQFWAGGSTTRRPAMQLTNNSSALRSAAITIGLSLYYVHENIAYEAPFSSSSSNTSANAIRWNLSQFELLSTFDGGDTVHVLIADSGEQSQVLRFAQDLPNNVSSASLSANMGTETVALSWDAAVDATGYQVERSTNGTNWGNRQTVSGTSHTYTNLTGDLAYFFRVRASNSNGESDWTDGTATSTPAADLIPSLVAIANQSASVGVAFSFTLPAATSGNPPISYNVTGRPSWLNFNTSTRVLSGTPTAAGSWSLTYTATDDDGDPAVRTFTMNALSLIKLGSLNVDDFKLGSNDVSRLYVGSTRVW